MVSVRKIKRFMNSFTIVLPAEFLRIGLSLSLPVRQNQYGFFAATTAIFSFQKLLIFLTSRLILRHGSRETEKGCGQQIPQPSSISDVIRVRWPSRKHTPLV